MRMKSRLISVTQPQEEFLTVESQRLGISVSDLVRRIIDAYRENR